MNLQEILEVAIGLVFMWLVLSLATMQVLEWFRTLSKTRAKDLEKAVHRLLSDPGLSDRFYSHPIIKSLFPAVNKLPSYIPARQFAQVLLDVVASAGTEASLIHSGMIGKMEAIRSGLAQVEDKDKRKAAGSALEAMLELTRQAASSDAGIQLAGATLTRLEQHKQEFIKKCPRLKSTMNAIFDEAGQQLTELQTRSAQLPSCQSSSFDQLRKGILALGVLSPGLERTMSTMITGLEGNAGKVEDALASARTKTEDWFNASMDRLSGEFKRRGQVWTLLIAFILAVFLNVDSIQIARSMWREPTVRQVLVAQADQIQYPVEIAASDPQQAMSQFLKYFEGLNLPLGWKFVPLGTTAGTGTAPIPSVQCSFQPAVGSSVFGIRFDRALNLWLYRIEAGCYRPLDTQDATNGWAWMGLKVLGILLSALAALQGAPFWFDILKKMVNIRGSGSNPAETPQKAPAA